ncbi:MAG: VanZ family protein [Burkholderiales bacterium]|nr:VanZ family protein [Burkholderiales bacterium]
MWDKLNHAVGFAGLTLAACLACGRCNSGHLARLRDTMRPALLMLAFGALIEVLQSFVPERSAEWADLLADGIGVVLGALLARGLRRLAADRRG